MTAGSESHGLEPGIEVGREREQAAGVDERARRRQRAPERQRGGRQRHADDVGGGQLGDALGPGRLEMVERARPELDREIERTDLGELVAVQAQREAVLARRLEIAPRLLDVERTALAEHVGGLGQPPLRDLGQDLVDAQLDVGVGALGVLGHGVGGQAGGHDVRGRLVARLLDRAQHHDARSPSRGRSPT